MQKTDNGITIIALIIAVVLILIFASVAITAGTSAYDNAKVSGFVSRMNIIQEQVNIAHIKIKNGDTSVNNYGQSIPDAEINRVQTALAGTEYSDYSKFRYFDSNDLIHYFNLDKVKETIIVNFDSIEVYSLQGIMYKGEIHYTQYDLPNGQFNVGYVDPGVGLQPDFDIQK